MTPYGVIMVMVSAYGNLYGEFSTRRYTWVLLHLAVSYGREELKFEPHAKVAHPHDFVAIALEETSSGNHRTF